MRNKDYPVQPFPTTGPLFDNLDLPKTELAKRIGRLPGMIRLYKMISISRDKKGLLEQRGSAPNYEGGCLTLCTCARQIRAERHPDEWLNDDWWFAGVTRQRQCGGLWLFYLAKIEKVYKSQSDICKALSAKIRKAKTTRTNRLGDIYEPKPLGRCTDHFNAAHYHSPMIRHSHHLTASHDYWKSDIEFSGSTGLHAPCLIANPILTFLWQTPLLLEQHQIHVHKKFHSVTEFLDSLRVAG